MLYRLLIALLWPFALVARLIQGESLSDVKERLGLIPDPEPGPVVWLHGASNGELTSARWLVLRLLEEKSDLRLLITSNTLSARTMVRGWQLDRVTAALAPLDAGLAISAFLRRRQVLALISLEAELWPNRFAHCARKGLPILMLGARMSGRSFRGWRRHGHLAQTALAAVSFASAQDEASRDRLVELGLPSAVLGPIVDLKAEAVARLPQVQPLPRAQRADWLLAASTHEGEDEIVVEAFAGSKLTHLILAPRHPRRGDSIAAMLTRRGLAFQRRSQGGQPGGAPILLADTLGEMDTWYARAGICFIGGTLVDKGGHTPWEPARHGCALIHGPSLWNFAGPFAALQSEGASLQVSDAMTMGQALSGLQEHLQEQLATAAITVLRSPDRGEALVQAILKVLAT